MYTQQLSLHISDAIGSVAAEYIVPEKSSCILTLAHGAGAGMNHAFMVALANGLAKAGLATLRFNFPFMEHGKKRVDSPAVSHSTIQTAIDHARKSYPLLPLFASGKSFGGRMTSQLLALANSSDVKGIIFYGFPLHPAGNPSIARAAHLEDIILPMLFLQGTRDELAVMELMEGVCSLLPTATLVQLDGVDHSFKAGRKDVVQTLINETVEWTNKLLKV